MCSSNSSSSCSGPSGGKHLRKASKEHAVRVASSVFDTAFRNLLMRTPSAQAISVSGRATHPSISVSISKALAKVVRYSQVLYQTAPQMGFEESMHKTIGTKLKFKGEAKCARFSPSGRRFVARRHPTVSAGRRRRRRERSRPSQQKESSASRSQPTPIRTNMRPRERYPRALRSFPRCPLICRRSSTDARPATLHQRSSKGAEKALDQRAKVKSDRCIRCCTAMRSARYVLR